MKKVEIAERAQREASNVEKDYEEVVQLLEAEVVKLKEDRKIVSTVNWKETSKQCCKLKEDSKIVSTVNWKKTAKQLVL